MSSNATDYSNSSRIDSPSDSQCEMFGSFGYIVQFILGVLSFMVLIVKRFLEKPKRPWKIWFFDVSKQVISAALAHLMNLFLAVFLSLGNNTDQCVWYFINIFVDTALGVLICYFLMSMIERLARSQEWKSLQSGLYYEFYEKNRKKKTKLNYKMYFMQLIVWLIVVIVTKLFLLGMQKLASQFLEKFGNSVLSPFEDNGKLKLLMVMVIIPLVLNAINFWLIDNILKLNTKQAETEGINISAIYVKETGDVNDLRDLNQVNVVNQGNQSGAPDVPDVPDVEAIYVMDTPNKVCKGQVNIEINDRNMGITNDNSVSGEKYHFQPQSFDENNNLETNSLKDCSNKGGSDNNHNHSE